MNFCLTKILYSIFYILHLICSPAILHALKIISRKVTFLDVKVVIHCQISFSSCKCPRNTSNCKLNFTQLKLLLLIVKFYQVILVQSSKSVNRFERKLKIIFWLIHCSIVEFILSLRQTIGVTNITANIVLKKD